MSLRPIVSPRLRATCRVLALFALLATAAAPVGAGPIEPDHPPLLGTPDRWRAYWHDQRQVPTDAFACALYAQASVLEALGYDFETELQAARALGERDRWYSPTEGAIGLGQPLRARQVPFTVLGTPLASQLTAERALLRLQLELSAGRLAIANVDASHLAYYAGSAVRWHTLWITGLRLDGRGLPVSVVANDSYRGPAVEYPIDEFLAAWGSEFHYYAIFVAPDQPTGGS